MRLTGFSAIEYAERAGITLNKQADRIDDGAEGLSIAEAEAIADDRPDLIWLEVEDDEYYGEPRNMEPGDEPTKPPKLAGQRSDELAPGQNGGRRSRGAHALGSAEAFDRNSIAAGIAGDNAPHSELDDSVEDTLNSGLADRLNDGDPDEPQAGRSGGAVGGTPAGKRVRPK